LRPFASSSACRSSNLLSISLRSVSSKYIRPHPRPYKRRWYEAAVAPVMPESRRTCPSMVELKQRYEKERDEYSEIEIALTNLVRSWIERESFRTLAVCQFLPINGRTLWLTRNQLRLKGLEFRNYGNRIMRKVFEGTPLEALNVLFVGSNCTLFGKDVDAIQTVITECDKIAWIVPLVHDCRILSMAEARDLCKRKSFEEHRVETLGTISQISRNMVLLMGEHLNDLTRTLDQIALRNESKE
uniref:Large ribosomal subunit protein uL10m n=1 Tax=Parascaris univalens TaxID=6257 RepID=A0A915AF26_PARUN